LIPYPLVLDIRHCQSKEASILWSHHGVANPQIEDC